MPGQACGSALSSTITPNDVSERADRPEAQMSVAQKDGIDPRSYTDRITYEDLYQRWEAGNWKAYEIDFSEDRQGWEALSEIQRKSALWTYSLFFYGADAVT